MNRQRSTIILILSFATVSLSHHVNADNTTEISQQMAHKMRQHQVVTGRFEQQRQLTGIPIPIHSSGRFIFWRDYGLYWETQQPILQSSTFTPESIINWRSNGSMRTKDRSSSPIQKQISRILLAVFGGDTQSLDKYFSSHWHAELDPWTVDVTPTTTSIKKVIQNITLTGSNYINSLSVTGGNGDTTQIHFFGLKESVLPAANDCLYFDLDPSSCLTD